MLKKYITHAVICCFRQRTSGVSRNMSFASQRLAKTSVPRNTTSSLSEATFRHECNISFIQQDTEFLFFFCGIFVEFCGILNCKCTKLHGAEFFARKCEELLRSSVFGTKSTG